MQHRWPHLQSDAVTATLRDLPFVTSQPGTTVHPRYVRARELWDPRVPLFQKLWADDDTAGRAVFPSGRWAAPAGLDWLKLIGLRHKLTADTFVDCARKVQALGRLHFRADALFAAVDRPNAEAAAGAGRHAALLPAPAAAAAATFAAAAATAGVASFIEGPADEEDLARWQSHHTALALGQELVTFLWANVNDIGSPALLTALADVAFVPVTAPPTFSPARPFTRAIQIEAQAALGDRGEASRGGGVSSFFAALVQSSPAVVSAADRATPVAVPILTSYRRAGILREKRLVWTILPILDHEPAHMAWKHLGLRSPPPFGLVVTHLRNICHPSLDAWAHADPPHVVFGDVCKHLTEQLPYLTSEQRAQLKELPLVPMGHRLLKATRLYFRLEQDLSPFMFEVPRTFSAYEELLKVLGAQESATSPDYFRFLQDLALETQGQVRHLFICPLY